MVISATTPNSLELEAQAPSGILNPKAEPPKTHQVPSLSDPNLTPKISSLFNSEDADLIFRSSDGVLFKIHSANSKLTTGDLPRGRGDVTDLAEPSYILELLFQFMYPIPQPDLSGLDATTLIEFGDAASHYNVFPAIPVCNMILGQFLPASAVDILQYAFTFNHTQLMNLAARDVTPTAIVEILPEASAALNKTWTLYWSVRCQAFSAVFTSRPEMCSLTPGYAHQCSTWNSFMVGTLARVGQLLAAGATTLESIASVIAIEDPRCCRQTARKWKSDVNQALAACKAFSECIVPEGEDDDD